ncbi:hypothetical protein LY76DRAFT_125758 [Colletotrichum caudatum]|nr:hypothetical protein LY76DRAFT_125758 [Colletotrichum caudatum]
MREIVLPYAVLRWKGKKKKVPAVLCSRLGRLQRRLPATDVRNVGRVGVCVITPQHIMTSYLASLVMDGPHSSIIVVACLAEPQLSRRLLQSSYFCCPDKTRLPGGNWPGTKLKSFCPSICELGITPGLPARLSRWLSSLHVSPNPSDTAEA